MSSKKETGTVSENTSVKSTANKKHSKRRTLFSKYFAATFFTIALSFIVLGVLMMAFITNYWTESNASQLKKNVNAVAATTEQLYASGISENNKAYANLLVCNMLSIESKAVGADVFMCDLNGHVILCKDLIKDGMQVSSNATCKIHQGITMPSSILSATTHDGYYTMDRMEGIYNRLTMVVGTTINMNGRTAGYVYATIPVGDGLMPYITGMLKIFLVAVIITLLVSAIAVYMYVYGLTKPLHEMTELTRSYARGDFSKRIDIDDNTEIGELAQCFNSMAQSLDELEDSRSSFVANVSHELKTPMTTISGFIDGIQDGTIPEKDRDRYLNIIGIEVKRLARLVVAMLSLSKIESGDAQLEKKQILLPQMMFTILLNFEPMISKYDINVEGFDKMDQTVILADEDMIYQVIYNLFDNAVKFTPEKGTITVSAEENENRVYVHIKNTGEGIPPDQIKRVFEKFYKVDKSRSEDVKGVGLGLSLVKKIVLLHGGEVYVESEVGRFTMFTFWLPKE